MSHNKRADDGNDCGIYPNHDYVIYFLSPDGNDKNDGTSVRKAWKTLGRAIKALEPGGTLYLTEGVYSIEAPITDFTYYDGHVKAGGSY